MVELVIGMFDMDQNTVILNNNYNKEGKKKKIYIYIYMKYR